MSAKSKFTNHVRWGDRFSHGMWEGGGRADVPIAGGPKPVPRLLSDDDMHRVCTRNLPSWSQVANVRGWQLLNPYPPRSNCRKRDLEVDRLGTLLGGLCLSPKRKALPDEKLRASFISVVANRRLPLNLRNPTVNQNGSLRHR